MMSKQIVMRRPRGGTVPERPEGVGFDGFYSATSRQGRGQPATPAANVPCER